MFNLLRKSRIPKIVSVLFLTAAASVGYGQAASLGVQDPAAQLLGQWRAETEFGSFLLIFHTADRLEFDGETAGYTLLPGIIRVRDEEGVADYRYQLQGNTLLIAFPEGYQLQFERVGSPPPSQQPERQYAEPEQAVKPPEVQSRKIPPPSQKTTSSSAVDPGEVGDPNWGFKFNPPAGWKYQLGYKGAILGHDAIAGMILVIPHLAGSPEQVQSQMQEGLQDGGTQLFPSGAIRPSGQNVFTGEYTGTMEGQTIKGKGIGTFSPYGGGAYIIALTVPEKFGPELSSAADAVAGNMLYFQVDVSDLFQYFTGMWAHVTANTLTNVEFYPNGAFEYIYEGGYSGTFSDQLGNQTGNWGANANDKTQGRWTVRGTKEEGVIIISFPDGSETWVQYQVHRSGGRTYWSEYFFDGKLYSKRR